jgi:Dyp-type peroxidase family
VTARLDVDDLQGNILRPYRFPVAGHVFLRLGDAEEGRRFVGRLAARVTSAAEWVGDKPPCAVNVALSWTGLRALGVAERLLDAFPIEFRQGMAGRAVQLGDTAASAPGRWDAGLGTGEAHLLISVNGQSDKVLHATVHGLLAGAGDGLRVVHTQSTHRLPGDREHFGFRDGIGQPAVEGVGDPHPGGGIPQAGGTWRTVPVGEFILGYRAADGTLPDGPPSPLDRNSSYLVYRKLEQDVAGYRRFIADQGRNFPGGERMLAAKLVGRWPDGTPLALSPDCEDPGIATDAVRRNDFGFGPDPLGLRCPVGAHIRRANPRDGLQFHGAMVSRHRLIRRGAPYGPALPEGVMESDGIGRGVLFYAFNASFARQFEFIQSQWLNDGNALGLGTDRDPVAGAGARTRKGPEVGASDAPPVLSIKLDKMTVPGSPPRFVAPLPNLVTTKGGEYLWMPGLAALRDLGAADSPLMSGAGDRW